MPRPRFPLLDLLRRRLAEDARALASAAGRLLAAGWRWLWPPGPRHAAAALALALAAASLLGMAFQSGLPARLPTDLDWRSAAAVLARDGRPGDAVALSPAWAERGRLLLPAGLPVLALPGLQGEPLWGVRRVWLLSLPEAPGADGSAARELAGRSSGGEPPQRLGALELRRYDLAAPALPLAFLPDRLAGARVTLGGRPCPAVGGAFRCGEAGVSREVRPVDGRPRPCMVLRAVPEAPLAVVLPAAPLGRVLRGHAGAAGEGGPVDLQIRAAGAEVVLRVDGPGWRSFELTGGEPQDVTFTVRSEGAAGAVCLDAAGFP